MTTSYSSTKNEISLEEGNPASASATATTVSRDEEDFEPSVSDFGRDETSFMQIPPADKKVENIRRRLSSISKMYDVDGDGVLDEYEQALRDMDQTGRGFISNAQAVSLLKEQVQLQKSLLNFKKIILVLVIFTLILALSNLGTAWAAATLAKDTTVQDGALVSKKDSQVVVTGDNVLTVQAETFKNDQVNKNPSGRHLVPVVNNFQATVSTLPKIWAQGLFAHCPNPANVQRVFPMGGIHNIQVCPGVDTGSSTVLTLGGTVDVYTFDMYDNEQLVVSCPANLPDCTMSGNALLLSAYKECIDHTDCRSGSCTQKLSGAFSCDECNPESATNSGCDAPFQCFSMGEITDIAAIADAPPQCLIPFNGDCSNNQYSCVTNECHNGICLCNTLTNFGCAAGEICEVDSTSGYPACVSS